LALITRENEQQKIVSYLRTRTDVVYNKDLEKKTL
jgi:hypothetical protein